MKVSSNSISPSIIFSESSPLSKGATSAKQINAENLVISESNPLNPTEVGPLDFDERAALDRDDPLGRLVSGAFTLEARPFGEMNLI